MGLKERYAVGWTDLVYVPPTVEDFIRELVDRANFEHEAFTVSLDTLEDLWITRFGVQWVNWMEIKGDPLFTIATVRLHKTKKLDSWKTDTFNFRLLCTS